MISFVFPQEKKKRRKKGGSEKKKSAKINIFVSVVQPQEKYEHIGEEIKMMDLLADVCVCSCALCKCVRAHVCVFVCSAGFFGCYNWCIVPDVFKSSVALLNCTC